jgi:protein gp37
VIFVNSMSDLFHELVPLDFVARVFAVMALAGRHTFQVLTKRPEVARAHFEDGLEDATFRALAELARANPRWRSPAFEGPGSRSSWPLPNVWLGVSIENSRYTGRADELRQLPAAVRFISAEPLLGSLFQSAGRKRPLDLTNIDWLIAGGESGPMARPMQISWARELRDACAERGVAFFFKQWGGRTSKSGGRELDGEYHDEMPAFATG